jgi:hypothetical protein
MLGTLIATLLSGEAANSMRRARKALAAYLFAAVLAAVGLGFLIGAAYMAAARRLGPIEAALVFGGFFVFVAIVIVGVHSYVARRQARIAAERRASDLAAVAGLAAVSALPGILRGKAASGGVGVAAAAAVAYGVYREYLRRKDRDLGDY